MVHVPLPELVSARFVERPNRFVLHARLEGSGEVVRCHLPDPGRLRELLMPGARLWLEPATDPERKTPYSAILVEGPGAVGPICLVTTLPNRLVDRGLRQRALDELAAWSPERREATIGGSRFDFLLRRGDRRLVLEVKGVTLVQEGVALFPDAVTARGTRHVEELTGIVEAGEAAGAVLFVMQRPDADSIRPAAHIDPEFAAALAIAHASGVRLLGRRTRVSRDRVVLGEPVPVVPEPPADDPPPDAP